MTAKQNSNTQDSGRTLLPLQIADLSSFTRSLHQQLATDTQPSHLSLMNMLARGAGFRNVQHLRASFLAGDKLVAPAATVDMQRIAQVLRHFDNQGRLARWPARTWQQYLALWPLWAQLPPRQDMTERQISTTLNAWHGFGDAAILRRTMCEKAMITRTPDGSVYRRTEQTPPHEALALIRHLSAKP